MKKSSEKTTQIYNVETYSAIDVSLVYKGEDYNVEIKVYDGFDGGKINAPVIYDLSDNKLINPLDPIFDEIIEYVESQVIK